MITLYKGWPVCPMLEARGYMFDGRRMAGEIPVERLELHGIRFSHRAGIQLLSGFSLKHVLDGTFLESSLPVSGTEEAPVVEPPLFYHLVSVSGFLPYRIPIGIDRAVLLRATTKEDEARLGDILPALIALEALS